MTPTQLLADTPMFREPNATVVSLLRCSLGVELVVTHRRRWNAFHLDIDAFDVAATLSRPPHFGGIRITGAPVTRHAHINDLVVSGEHRRRGLGSLLLVEALRLLAGGGIATVGGSLVERDLGDSPFLQRFYERHGFAVLEGRIIRSLECLEEPGRGHRVRDALHHPSRCRLRE